MPKFSVVVRLVPGKMGDLQPTVAGRQSAGNLALILSLFTKKGIACSVQPTELQNSVHLLLNVCHGCCSLLSLPLDSFLFTCVIHRRTIIAMLPNICLS